MSQVMTPSKHASVWKLLGSSFSTIFPPGFNIDWGLVAQARREFDPNFVPLYHVREYQPPDGGRKMEIQYFVIGRWSPVKDDAEREPIDVKLPSRPDKNFPFKGGYIYDQKTWAYPWPKGTDGARRNMPDVPREFDGRTVAWMREAWHSFHRVDRSVREQWEKRQAELDRQELEYICKVEADAQKRLHDDAELTKAIEEGTLNDPIEVEVSTPHVQAEKVMPGTALESEKEPPQ